MDEAEALIATRASKAGITVGLFDAYGPAQRLYARKGYVPDGVACAGPGVRSSRARSSRSITT